MATAALAPFAALFAALAALGALGALAGVPLAWLKQDHCARSGGRIAPEPLQRLAPALGGAA